MSLCHFVLCVGCLLRRNKLTGHHRHRLSTEANNCMQVYTECYIVLTLQNRRHVQKATGTVDALCDLVSYCVLNVHQKCQTKR